MSKTNTFEEIEMENMVEKESLPEEKEQKQEEEELGMDIFSTTEFLKSPEVEESIEFTVEKIVNNPIIEGTNKTTKEKFDIGVTRKDGTTIRYDIVTVNNERFTLNSWALFYLFVGKNSLFKAKAQELGSMKGIKVKLTRNYDGSVPNKKPKEVMKLYDLKTEEEAIKYQKEVAKALKEGRLFTLEILE